MVVDEGSALVDAAEMALSSGSQPAQLNVSAQIAGYLSANSGILQTMGYGWLVDQLDTAQSRLSGNGPGAAQAPKSVASAALGGFTDGLKAGWQKLQDALPDNQALKMLSVAAIVIGSFMLLREIRR